MSPTVADLRKQLQQTPKLYTTFMGRRIGPQDATGYRPFLEFFFVQKYLRGFSIFFTRLVIATPIRANHVTFFTILLGMCSALLFSYGRMSYNIIAAALLQLIHILDCTDGEVARYKQQSSHRGDFLDVVQHWTTPSLVFLFMSYGLYAKYSFIWLFALGGLFAIAYLLRELYNVIGSHLILKRAQYSVPVKMHHTAAPNAPRKDFLSQMSYYIGFIFDFYMISTVLLLFSVFDLLLIPFLFYAVLLPITVALGLIYEFKSDGKKSFALIAEYVNKQHK